jgi:ATP phosphoribosyltransferase
MPDWTASTPLRVVTGYHNVARKFFAEHDFPHVVLLSADGALEAAPLMGSADIILDLVSTGVTLRENNLKEIEGGTVLRSQGVLVANRRSLEESDGMLELVRELIERLEVCLPPSPTHSLSPPSLTPLPSPLRALALPF